MQSHKAPAGVQRLCLLHNIQGSIFAAVPGKGNIVPGAGKLQNGGGTNAALPPVINTWSFMGVLLILQRGCLLGALFGFQLQPFGSQSGKKLL